MRYFHTDVSNVSRGIWRGYISELDYYFQSSSKPKAEYEAYRIIEECEGFHSFSVIFNEV